MWLTLGASLFWARPASADLVLFDKDGWTFFTDGRINSFYSLGYGDAFPTPTPNPTPPIVDPNGTASRSSTPASRMIRGSRGSSWPRASAAASWEASSPSG